MFIDFMDFLIDIIEGIFWLAEKKKINKFASVIVYSIALLPIIMGMGYFSIKNFLAHDIFEALMLSLIGFIAIIIYLYALKIIFSRDQVITIQ
jgi:hypothetical protein